MARKLIGARIKQVAGVTAHVTGEAMRYAQPAGRAISKAAGVNHGDTYGAGSDKKSADRVSNTYAKDLGRSGKARSHYDYKSGSWKRNKPLSRKERNQIKTKLKNEYREQGYGKFSNKVKHNGDLKIKGVNIKVKKDGRIKVKTKNKETGEKYKLKVRDDGSTKEKIKGNGVKQIKKKEAWKDSTVTKTKGQGKTITKNNASKKLDKKQIKKKDGRKTVVKKNETLGRGKHIVKDKNKDQVRIKTKGKKRNTKIKVKQAPGTKKKTWKRPSNKIDKKIYKKQRGKARMAKIRKAKRSYGKFQKAKSKIMAIARGVKDFFSNPGQAVKNFIAGIGGMIFVKIICFVLILALAIGVIIAPIGAVVSWATNAWEDLTEWFEVNIEGGGAAELDDFFTLVQNEAKRVMEDAADSENAPSNAVYEGEESGSISLANEVVAATLAAGMATSDTESYPDTNPWYTKNRLRELTYIAVKASLKAEYVISQAEYVTGWNVTWRVPSNVTVNEITLHDKNGDIIASFNTRTTSYTVALEEDDWIALSDTLSAEKAKEDSGLSYSVRIEGERTMGNGEDAETESYSRNLTASFSAQIETKKTYSVSLTMRDYGDEEGSAVKRAAKINAIREEIGDIDGDELTAWGDSQISALGGYLTDSARETIMLKLFGIESSGTGTSAEVANIALSQVGNDYSRYTSAENSGRWCSEFASWCVNAAGMAGIDFSYGAQGVSQFRALGKYLPMASASSLLDGNSMSGWIAFCHYGSAQSHTAVVISCTSNGDGTYTLITVEGNTTQNGKNGVWMFTHTIDKNGKHLSGANTWYEIYGLGMW